MSKNAKKAKGRRAQPKKVKTATIVGAGGGALAVVIVLFLVLGGTAQTVKAAPAWEAQSIDGSGISGVGLKGDVYVMDFFFTWCPICAKQYPAKAALAEHFADREDFHLISISADPNDTPAKLDEYRQKHGSTWTFVSDTYGLYQKFNVNSRPFMVFIDRDGNIVETFTRITDSDTLIELAQEILDKPAASADGNANVEAFAPLLAIPAALHPRRMTS